MAIRAHGRQARRLRPTDLSIIFEIVLQLLLPSHSQSRSRSTDSEIFTECLDVVISAIRRRTDLVVINLPALITIASFIFPLLQKERNAPSRSPTYRSRVCRRWPFWISEHDAGLGENEGRLLTRLLISLCHATISAPRSTELNYKAQSLAGPLAKHAPSILVAYVRAASDPVAGLSTEVRRSLEPGLFAICDLMTSGGRVEGHGREGESIGLPFGLGEGAGREVEKEVWAEMWRTWGKKRYVGQG